MTPIAFLLLAVGVTVVAFAIQRVADVLHRKQLVALAQGWQLQFSPQDQFHLIRHVAGQLPAVGPANVRIVDIIYGLEDASHRYFLTAEYTTGVLRSKKRRRQVCTFRESRSPGGEFSALVLADPLQSLINQYRELYDRTR